MSKDYPLPRERGNKKWTSLMLSEHRQRILDWKNDLDLIQRPILTLERRQELADSIQEAFYNQSIIALTYYCKGRLNQISGRVTRCRVETQSIEVTNEKNGSDYHIIHFSDLVDIL